MHLLKKKKATPETLNKEMAHMITASPSGLWCINVDKYNLIDHIINCVRSECSLV